MSLAPLMHRKANSSDDHCSQVWCGVLICSLTMQSLLPPEKVKKVRVKMRRQLHLCNSHASSQCAN
eukprot:SAG11_NODE_27195_length_335_cov_1.745763_1_plen_65_part_10